MAIPRKMQKDFPRNCHGIFKVLTFELSVSMLLRNLSELKRFHFFPESFRFFLVCFRCFSGLFPESFRKKVGKHRPKKEQKLFQKKRNLLSFGVRNWDWAPKHFPPNGFQNGPLPPSLKDSALTQKF